MANGTAELVIYRENDEWKVCFEEDRKEGRGPDHPDRVRPSPGTMLRWRFDPPQPANVVAHFQFTDDNFVKNPSKKVLSPHWTATLPGNDSLILELTGKPYRRVHYAVFVASEGTGEFAIGCNPPPKVDVGP